MMLRADLAVECSASGSMNAGRGVGGGRGRGIGRSASMVARPGAPMGRGRGIARGGSLNGRAGGRGQLTGIGRPMALGTASLPRPAGAPVRRMSNPQMAVPPPIVQQQAPGELACAYLPLNLGFCH